MKKTISVLLISAFSLSFLSACNTVKGAGRDIQNTGKAIQKSAAKSS